MQYLTGSYLFGASRQTSLLELFFPRVGLHFTYNLLAFIPTILAIYFYWRAKNPVLKVGTRKDVERPSNVLLTNIEKFTCTSVFVTILDEAFYKPINLFATHIERSLSLKDHLNLIWGIVARALGIGILSCTLVFVVIGIYGFTG